MASAAEQLAANWNFGAFAKAEDLKRRILFTLGGVARLPARDIHPAAGHQSCRVRANVQIECDRHPRHVQYVCGGAVERMAIFALNIMPYISASIIMQLMSSVDKRLEALKKEGEQGRKTINQYTRYLTVLLATVQAFFIATGLEGSTASVGGVTMGVVIDKGIFFKISTVVTLVGGTMFLMWLGEQITARGIGNGISLIIFAGIVAELPRALGAAFELARTGAMPVGLLMALLALMFVVVAVIVFMERAQRRLLIQYPKRQVGNRMFQGDSSHLPLKLNSSGVIPPIFASSLLLLPTTAAQFTAGQGPNGWERHGRSGLRRALAHALYRGAHHLLLLSSTRRSCSIRRRRRTICASMAASCPARRPGAQTAEYIDYVLTRITVVGALYLTVDMSLA